ncbi:MAG: polymerase III, beta subunit, DNA polymerase III subunit beta protein [candidate division CPR1 bacterium GW2011_GWC1_49_13]|uniref:Beta sliding clamp n=1 Tax=candidate division CPR1 bacterium GW2011_GWC1_49_13 TaxID=1618342 RepID=A0A0G1VGE4_9BACT|nr:MAG: polymerase III, beta subunit, DNA polymerase III subunit beta protein [candidate division CPR1 bacterium GW2011_GWC1_49_13]
MKVTVSQEQLLPRLSAVSKFASSKAALPVLENIFLQAKKGVLTLSATDLETGVRTSFGAQVKEEGELTIPARLLVSLISNLPAGKLTLETDKDILKISAEGFSSKINGLSAAEFPAFSLEGVKLFTLPSTALKKSISQVSFAAAADESRPILTGVLVSLAGGSLTLAGVDGFRLAQKRIKVPAGDLKLVISARSLSELSRLLEGEVTVLKNEDGQLIFQTEDFQVFAQALEGEFPDYEQIIPANFETTLKFRGSDLSKAVSLSSLFADSGVGVVVLDFDPAKKELEVSSQESETGESKTKVAVAGEGKKGTIAFNSRYLSDALAAFGDEEINLSLNSALDPVLFTTPSDKAYLHVIMPVRLQG